VAPHSSRPSASGSAAAKAVLHSLTAARQAFVEVVDFVAGRTQAQPNEVFAGSVPYLMLAGNLVAGWQLARALLVAERKLAEGDDAPFMRAKIATAHFYADHILSRVPGIGHSIVHGAAALAEMPLDAL